MTSASATTADAAAVCQASDSTLSGHSTLSGAGRVERAIEMAEEVQQIRLDGIAHRHPEFSAGETHREWLRILPGEAIAQLIS